LIETEGMQNTVPKKQLFTEQRFTIRSCFIPVFCKTKYLTFDSESMI